MPAIAAQSSIAAAKAPLWLMKAIGPLGGLSIFSSGRNTVSTPVSGTYTPTQLGPITLIPLALAISRISCSILLPSSPSSPNPPVIIITDFIPFSPIFLMVSGTAGAGIAITARSVSSGSSETS
ncbi:123aa long hypothetical protein [Pyrococcus horikoshii OT3]|uniref:Uncharacterized protein n=1 Tax=Pyrococcus horikoshii (strain ATCC 700860 / DSM 12428 / JCM 9974 / NBRC 100139 / OT-3) TaxID=70601 RepID=O59455_PYRHO|nr:123aa long hypothetical protein [Pyrococcus horikoshii OT3]